MSTFAMDKESLSQTWVGNMYLRLEAVCQEFDEFINQDPVKYLENHIQTVGRSMKKFYDGFMEELILPPSVEAYTKSVAAIKENTIDNNTSLPEEGPLIPTEECYKLSPTCEISESPAEEVDTNSNFEHEDNDLINKTSLQVGEILYNTTSESDDAVFEDADWGIESITDLNLEIKKKIEEEPLVEENYEKVLIETLVSDEGELLCNTNSESDDSVFEDADWGIENIIDLNLEIEKKVEEEPLVEENYEKVLMETLVSDEGELLCNSNSDSDDSVFEDADWGIEDILDLNLEKKVDEPLVEENSEKVFMETLVSDEFVCDSDASRKMERIITCNENKDEEEPLVEENSEKVLMETLVSDKVGCDSDTSSKMECLITCKENKEEKAKSDSSSMGDYFSTSSYDILSCESSTSHDHHNNNDSTGFSFSGFSLYSETTDELDSFMVDFNDLNMETINLSDKKQLGESCVIVEGEKVFSFPFDSGKSKSYKKIIQDAFMSRNKLTKEYKQLAIWCEDIDKELSRKAHGNATNSQVQDSPDSEWELL